MTMILMNIGAVITLGLGMMAIISPMTAARFTSIEPVGKMGRSEIRATYGGVFAALGACALYLQMPLVFLVLGVGWVGAAIARSISAILDRNVEVQNIGGIVFEAGIGLLLLSSHIAPAIT